jgi:pyrroline-5-carboxylate reductase
MAGVAAQVLPGLPWRAGQAVISVMADAPLTRLRDWCSPATDICITIPLPAIAQGGCPLPVWPESAALRALFGAANPVIAVRDEAALNAHFIATALVSVTLMTLRAGAGWLGGQTGDGAAAEAYVAALIGTSLRDLGPAGMAGALADLATPGGLNLTLRRHMEAAGTPGALVAGMDALAPRLGLSARGNA